MLGNDKKNRLVGLFFLVLVVLSGIAAIYFTLTSEQEEVTRACYDRHGNKIVGLECKQTTFANSDLIFICIVGIFVFGCTWIGIIVGDTTGDYVGK